MKYIILIPIYNDRESLKLLIENINNEAKEFNKEISLVVINDASSQQIIDTYPNIENIQYILLCFRSLVVIRSRACQYDVALKSIL